MTPAITQERLQELVRRESRSLLQYLREVPPWFATSDRFVAQKLHALASEQKSCIDELGKAMEKARMGVSHLGAFPANFTGINDAALGYVLPKLVAEHKLLIESLEKDLRQTDDEEFRPLVDKLIRLKKDQLQQLESLIARPYSSVSASST